jgi:hypothetical protein
MLCSAPIAVAVRFVVFWKNVLLHPFVWNCALFLFLYSFVINTVFGHRSFWRSKLPVSEYFLLGIWIKKYCRLWSEKLRFRFNTRSTSKVVSMDTLNDNTILHCLTFLSPADVLKMTCVNHFQKALCEQDYLWKNFSKQLIDRAEVELATTFSPLVVSISSNFSDKLNYFILHGKIVDYLLRAQDLIGADRERECRVLIQGRIYNLTQFVNEHPGGSHILLEWNGKDATRQFLIGNHSQFALRRAKELLMWNG